MLKKILEYFRPKPAISEDLVKEIRKFLLDVSRWDDCGCKPCMGDCRSPQAALFTMEEIECEAADLLKKLK